MNLSQYLVLAAVAVTAVFGQQPEENNLANETISFIQNSCKANLDAGVNPNATLMLESGYINGTKCVAASQAIIANAISKARNLLPQDPAAATSLLQKAFQDAQMTLFTYAIPTVLAYGAAFDLSNEGALGGLNNASISVQRAGFSALESLTAAEILFVAGIGAGGNSSGALLDACQLAVEAGFAGSFSNLQNAIQEANQGIRDAQSKPIQGQVENQKCQSFANDTATSEAVQTINEAASNATQNGATADLVQIISEGLICALMDYVNITVSGTQAVIPMETLAENDPVVFQQAYLQLVGKYTIMLEKLFSRIYILLGSVAFKSGIQSNKGMGAAILAIVEGEAEVGMGIESCVNIIGIGVKYGGGGPKIAIESAIKVGEFLQITFTQAIVKSAQLAFSAL